MKTSRPIAIVGMACRFPDAPNVSRYWQLLRDGRNAFKTPPSDRWDHEAFFSESHRASDRYYAPNGAFIDDVRRFAALEFGIPPRRLEVMDPQQRITLEAAWNAMVDAGYAPGLDGASTALRTLDRRRVGTFVGVTGTEYRTLLSSRAVAGLMAAGELGSVNADPAAVAAMAAAVNRVVPTRAFSAAGLLANMVAACVAQELDFGGPAYTLDAACASALVALHDACTWLRDGQIDTAVAGGVYLNLSPENLIAFSRIGAISASGVCRPFDARSDGFVQGEGVGMVVLKRLEDAVAANDRIYAVIAGSSCNNDGRGDGPMSPRAEGQIEVMQTAWDDAGVTPDSIGHIEAHGTGTSVGDRVELTALRAILRGRSASLGPVALGSAKANIGHTMSAAGIAGLIKATLALHHRTLPPLANWSAPHPDHDLNDGTFALPTDARPWHSVTPRTATVSSFGFGGTNGHIVLRQAPDSKPARLFALASFAALPVAGTPTRANITPDPMPAALPQLVVVSADTGELLADYLAELAGTLLDTPERSGGFAAVVHTLNLARKRRAVRCAMVASSVPELVERLAKAAAALQKDASLRGQVDRDTVIGDASAPAPVAFLCPGQGMQKVGLLREWLVFPEFASTMAEMEDAVREITPQPLLSYLYGPDATEAALTDTAIAQPAMFAIGVAVARVLRRFGIEPSVVLGHSLGEFTAAALSGGASPVETIRFVARRGQAMTALPGDHGAMAAAMATAEDIAPHLPEGVVIANRNHPRQNVISGPTDAVELAVQRLGAAHIKARRIPVSHAFHSPMLASVQADVDAGLGDVTYAAPAIAMASCIAERAPTSADAIRAIFQRHAVSPVEYVRGLGQCRDQGARIYIQLCAGATLAAFARGVLDNGESIVSVAADGTEGPGKDAGDHGHGLLRVLALCAANGHRVDLTAFGQGLATVAPTPLQTQTYWGVQETTHAVHLASARAPSAAESAGQGAPAAAVQAQGSPEAGAEAGAEAGVRARVLRVLSKVSAFPADALKSEQRLLDDLGFDSLMVNELAQKLTEDFPGFGGIPRSLFAKNPTVQDLVAHVERSTSDEVVDLTDPSRAMDLLMVSSVAAPKLPATVPAHAAGSGAARVLNDPTLETLRRQTPGDLVVCVPAHPEASEAARVEGVVGFVKSLAREWPVHNVRVVRGSMAEASLEAVGIERDPEVLYIDGERRVPRLSAAAETAQGSDPARLLAGDRVLLTGGTGWMGRLLARAMISAGADEVILVGTRADAGEALAELGSRARYLPLDVTNADAVAGLNTLGITRLVHAAGTLADGPMGTVDLAVARRAWAIKVDGLRNLLGALPGLKHAAAMGSYAGFFGNAYQTEYAAANAAMSAVIRQSGVPGGVQAWGPWDGSDMVATIPDAMKREMREQGVWFVDRERGVEAFLRALFIPEDVVPGLDVPAVRRVVETTAKLTPELPWLADHALYGKPTVPMAVIADQAAQLGCAVLGPVQVENLTLFDGVTVDKPVTMRTRIDGRSYSVWVGERGADRLAWKADLVDSAAMPAVQRMEAAESASAWDIATFYRDHTFHGPLLQGLTDVAGLGPSHVRGRVRIGAPAAWGSDVTWQFSPLAIDSAFQLAAVWAVQKMGRAGFPVRVARWTQTPVSAIVSADGTLAVTGIFRDAEADRFRGDIWLTDDTGAVVAYGEGVEAELRRVESGEPGEPGEPELIIPERFTDFAAFPEWVDLSQRLEAALMMGIDNPYFKTLEGIARDVAQIGGKELIHFSGYNYLGFSGHPYVEQRVMEAVRQYGSSVSASRVASGERPIHAELEQRLAQALQVDAALVFTAGHATNVTTLGHLFGPKDLLLHDELIHDSVFQGMRLSGATRRPFPHDDSAALAKMLTQLRPHFEKVCIIVEGVYSMDGDVCDLPAYIALKKKHKCFLMVDEAHSFGVVGERGLGVREHFNVAGSDVDIWMGTLSKSLSSCGGYIGGSKVLIELLKYTAPGFIFSAGLTPANTAAAIAALELMEREPQTVTKLQTNAAFYYAECQKYGLDNGPAAGESGVIPVIVGNSFHALLLSDALKKAGINVQPILYPAVADNASRLRFFLSSLHSEEQLAHTAATVKRELDRIRAEYPS